MLLTGLRDLLLWLEHEKKVMNKQNTTTKGKRVFFMFILLSVNTISIFKVNGIKLEKKGVA
jgi:hypothetical protein